MKSTETGQTSFAEAKKFGYSSSRTYKTGCGIFESCLKHLDKQSRANFAMLTMKGPVLVTAMSLVDSIDIGNGPSETQDIGLFSHQPNNDFGVAMEEAPSSALKDFDIEMSLFETSIIEEPMPEALHSITASSIPGSIPEFLNLGESCHSPPGSDIWDSCPPSPVSSPSLLSSSSSSESGIEDISDIEELSHRRTVMQSALSTEQLGDDSQQPVVVQVKKEEPSSPLNTAIASDNFLERRNGDRKKRRISRKCRNASNISDATEELTRLIENISSAAQPSLQSPTDTTQTTIASVFSVSGSPGIQTTALPSSQASCFPVAVQSCQVAITASTCSASTSNVASTATVTKTSSESLSTTQARIRAKPNKSTKKSGEPKLVILEEPEENYRARYESEGCRGPIHGSTDNTFPTVQVTGVSEPLWITVHLTTASGLPHYHSIHGPGSTKVPCKEIALSGGIPAVQVMVAPDTNMTAVLDSLSIRRLRNWEGDRELRKRGIDPRTWKKERKEAQLLFQAEIPGRDGHPSIKLICKSKVFQCSSSGPPGNPEIWWASISEGSVEGGDELGLIGKKFQSGFKVRFYSRTSSGDVWESFAEVDRSKSHQGAAVALTPAYCDTSITSPVTVNVVVTFGTGSGVKSSEPIEFIYRPKATIHAQEIEMHAANLSVTAPDSYLPEDLFACIGDVVLNDLASQMMEPAPIVVPAVSHQSDEQDWQALCIHISALHQKGLISSQHVKELCDFIKRRDTLLLQAFRSSRNASNTEELQANFKQYLSGMLCNL